MAWTSSVSLSRFVWAVHLGARAGSGPRADYSHAALAIWIRKLTVSAARAEGDSSVPNADETMLDWLVTFVRHGWTPREVLVWFFSVFLGFVVLDDL